MVLIPPDLSHFLEYPKLFQRKVMLQLTIIDLCSMKVDFDIKRITH